jgi:ferredoxin-type protein NapH
MGFLTSMGCLGSDGSEKKCTLCGACEKICPMGLRIPKELNSVECIRCLNCLSICPSKAIVLERSLFYLPHVDLKSITIKELKHAKK